MKKKQNKLFTKIIVVIVALILFFASNGLSNNLNNVTNTVSNTANNIANTITNDDNDDSYTYDSNSTIESNKSNDTIVSSSDIPDFDGETYDIEINGNKTYFTNDELNSSSDLFELSELDSLGRAGTAICVCSNDTIATTERGSIGMIKPSGWQTIRYDDLVDGKYLYNRSHLLMFAACDGDSGGRTNVEKNLITGTRYFNADTDHGMLHYESILLDYLESNENNVLYRVTPIYDGDNLVAKGVLMEAKSIEDDGENLEFCVFIYNEQPGITIDHSNGDSHIQTEEELATLLAA